MLATFVPAGAYHIAIGPDHLLFLLGLLLLGGSLRRLALIVTAFTLGHTVTLSLAALNIYAPPAAIIEPLIALSIVLVGVDNLLVGDGATASRDLRPWMAGLFGLVHGFGFASVLREFGLPDEALGWSLFGFNLGVELGQLAFVLPIAAAAGLDPRPVGPRRRASGDGRLCGCRAGRRVLVRPTGVLPWEWSMSRTGVLGGIVLAGVVAVAGRGLVAQQPAATGPNVAGIEKVKDNLWMVTGGGGNTAVFATANGVVLVDTKLANWGQAIMDQVKTVTDKPVTHIINTHTHGDHVGSNEYFPASVEIVAHANVSHQHGQDAGVRRRHQEARLPRPHLHRQDDGAQRQRRHRPLPLRPRAHQRRHLRRVPQPARDALRRRLLGQGHAAPRRQQRRQRRRLSRHASPR